MATAPVSSSALIEALRNAPSVPSGIASRVMLLPNSQNVGSTINFVPRSRAELLLDPTLLRLPTATPPPITPTPPAPAPRAPVMPPPAPRPVMPAPAPAPVPAPAPEPEPPSISEPDLVTETELMPPPPLRPEPPAAVFKPTTGTATEAKTPTVTLREVDVTDTTPPPTDPTGDFEIDRELGIVQQSDVLVPKTTTDVVTPTVTVDNVDVTDTPAPYTDPLDNFDIDRELGIVQQSDVYTPPTVLTPTSSTSTLTPSVTVNEVDVTDTPAVMTDPADDFELDRELGIVQQSDVYTPPTVQPTQEIATTPLAETVNEPLFAPTNTIANANVDYLGTPEQEMQLGMLLEPSAWTVPEPDLSVGLPPVVAAPAPSAPPVQLTEQDLLEMALFDMLAQQLLTQQPSKFVEEDFLQER